MAQRISERALDYIINEMIEVVENSKDEIFNISEEARTEHEHLVKELKETKIKVAQHIKDGDELEQKVRFSRETLSRSKQIF